MKTVIKVMAAVAFVIVALFVKAFFHSQRNDDRKEQIHAAVEKLYISE